MTSLDEILTSNTRTLQNSDIPTWEIQTGDMGIPPNRASIEGQRTELAMNIRTEDGMTNGASNVVKKVQLNQKDNPSSIIWVQFDDADIGQKTRNENRHLYVQGIHSTWTPIKPIATNFAVGRDRTVQVVRKQFPLRPSVAKTIHRSQGNTETKIVVNFDTERAIPHIHYVGLSTVTTMEGLHSTDLCESKIAVSPDVHTEMKWLRNLVSLVYPYYLFILQI